MIAVKTAIPSYSKSCPFQLLVVKQDDLVARVEASSPFSVDQTLLTQAPVCTQRSKYLATFFSLVLVASLEGLFCLTCCRKTIQLP